VAVCWLAGICLKFNATLNILTFKCTVGQSLKMDPNMPRLHMKILFFSGGTPTSTPLWPWTTRLYRSSHLFDVVIPCAPSPRQRRLTNVGPCSRQLCNCPGHCFISLPLSVVQRWPAFQNVGSLNSWRPCSVEQSKHCKSALPPPRCSLCCVVAHTPQIISTDL